MGGQVAGQLWLECSWEGRLLGSCGSSAHGRADRRVAVATGVSAHRREGREIRRTQRAAADPVTEQARSQ